MRAVRFANIVSDPAPVLRNKFGAVYPDHIAFRAKHGWGSKGVKVVPLQHITSVSIITKRSWIAGIAECLFGALIVLQTNAHHLIGPLLVGTFFLAMGAISLNGHPIVKIDTTSADLRVRFGAYWHHRQAREYVAALKRVLFAKS